MPHFFGKKPPAQKYRRCGACLKDKLDVRYDPERLIPICLECWGNMECVGGRNRMMASDRPRHA